MAHQQWLWRRKGCACRETLKSVNLIKTNPAERPVVWKSTYNLSRKTSFIRQKVFINCGNLHSLMRPSWGEFCLSNWFSCESLIVWYGNVLYFYPRKRHCTQPFVIDFLQFERYDVIPISLSVPWKFISFHWRIANIDCFIGNNLQYHTL